MACRQRLNGWGTTLNTNSPDPASAPDVLLCHSHEISDSGKAVSFDVQHAGQTCLAFVIRYQGQVRAYLNRCTHVAMEMDFRADHFFDETGQWLLCATHGAVYSPESGACAGGPCRGGLITLAVYEQDDRVYWKPDHRNKVVFFDTSAPTDRL
jgi:nitrite reductase/ring-hydroxylating ferredoxin subunit